MYYYKLFGRIVASDLEFAYLVKAEERDYDIWIHSGEIPEELLGKLFGCSLGEEVSWFVNKYCYLYILNRNEIIYKLKDGIEIGEIGAFIMGWGMAILGMQLEVNPMHCSAIASDTGAVLISGESGSGKSTVTETLLRKGWNFMADDMTYVEIEQDGSVMVQPAFPYQKLCRDAAMQKGYSLEELIYIDEDKDKFLVPYRGTFVSEKVPMKALILLQKEQREDVVLEELSGLHKMITCANNLFLRKVLGKERMVGEIGKRCFRMADGIRVFVIKRPEEGDSLQAVEQKVTEITQIL